jgi:nicotinamidase-related amidase
MGRKVLIVIDVQNCFLEGGSLAVGGADTPEEYAKKINTLIKEGGFTDVFLTQDVHHPENVSMMNLNMHKNKSNKSKYGEIPSGLPLRIGMYSQPQYKLVQQRRWGGDLTSQVLWPRHCIIRPDDPYYPKDYTGGKGQNKVGETYGSDLAFSLDAYKNPQHNYYKEPSHATIYHVYKGFDEKKDSYSAIADAVGEEDPFIARVNGVSKAPDTTEKFTKVLTQLNTEGISDIYVCGIATDFCVYQTTMDLIDLWMFSQKGVQQNKPKIHLIYDLTRGVIPPGIPGHKSEGDYYREAFKLLKDVNAPGCVADYFQVDLYKQVVKDLTGKNVPPAPVQNNNNYTGAFTAMFGETANAANLESSGLPNIQTNNMGGGRRNKTRRNHRKGCNCKSCWPKMKGGKKTRKPAGHKKGCKCVVCRR